ncbi:sodium/nucleoside cotransporter 1-like [Physella acuta]|uniref:sodium/nucleoside cotransporter 1-like n=1 Tax=Physella acuta TaxID=109671 RepID=UPI0027DDC120|nr:sodium/nucleoside cotransporter 1-like [Physella acuta]
MAQNDEHGGGLRAFDLKTENRHAEHPDLEVRNLVSNQQTSADGPSFTGRQHPILDGQSLAGHQQQIPDGQSSVGHQQQIPDERSLEGHQQQIPDERSLAGHQQQIPDERYLEGHQQQIPDERSLAGHQKVDVCNLESPTEIHDISQKLQESPKLSKASHELVKIEMLQIAGGEQMEDSSSESETDVETEKTRTLTFQVYAARSRCFKLCRERGSALKKARHVTCLLLYISYFVYAMYLHHSDGTSTGLIVLTAVLVLALSYRYLHVDRVTSKIRKLFSKHPVALKRFKRSTALACVVATVATLVTEVIMVRPKNLVSLTGMAAMLLTFFITSSHPHKIIWRPVVTGLLMQYVFALAVLRVPGVHQIFRWVGEVVTTLVSFSKEGGQFLFGTDLKSNGFVFHLIPLIIFVIAFLSVLEQLGVLHVLLKILGKFLAFCTGASPAESLNASANIFMGPLDSVLVVRPYLKYLTSSELHCFMSSAMSTVTGSIIGLYIAFGISADHLLAASVMSAPAALSLANLAVPETSIRKARMGGQELVFTRRYRSVIDAASSGAVSATTLAASILANSTAVVSFMKMINSTLGWLGQLVGIKNLTLQWICSFLFYPLALSMGVDVDDGRQVAELLGIKVFLNELVAYSELGVYRKNRKLYEDYQSQNLTVYTLDPGTGDVFLHGWNMTLTRGFLSERSEVITTYALCGFANFISVGIIMGCYIVLMPHRKKVIFKYILRSMVVGHCASFMTACVAGLLL